MLKYSMLVFFITIIAGGAFIAYSSQDKEPESLLDNVEFKEVKVIPTSESVYSLMAGDVAELSEILMPPVEDIAAYGFSDEEKTLHQRFFAVGNLCADLLGKLSGEYDKGFIVEGIKALRDGLDTLGAPNAVYIYLFNLENMVTEDEYSGEVIRRFLSMLYPFIEEFAQSAPSGALVSLQAGHWIVDFGIAAAGQHETLTRQSETALFFADAYEELDAPKGVVNGLSEIAVVASKPELNDEDFEQLMMLSEDIRRFLR
jgi:hypothetical protein